MERTVILYHGGCPDGFGGAYAAWKKFGDSATYISVKHGDPVPAEATGAEVYLIDLAFKQEGMDELLKKAQSLVVLDHHEGVKDVVTSMPSHVYDPERSGATIAWSYFHEGKETPELLRLVEDDDLFRFALPETRAIITYLTCRPFSFETWDDVSSALEDPVRREALLAKARAFEEYFLLLADLAVEHAKLIRFEGHECYFATAHPFKPMKSLIGNKLAKKKGPFGLVVTAHPEGLGVSIRGDGSVNVAEIAKKYGGNGHPNSAGFRLSLNEPMPWVFIKGENEED